MKDKTLKVIEPKKADKNNFNIEMLISQAIDKNLSVESMERLLAIRQQLKQEYAKEEFYHAMAAFQAKCPTIEKTKQGYNYKYAPLDKIIEQVKNLLTNEGFSYTFDTDEEEGAVLILCKVKHIAGHMEVSKAVITKETTTKMNASQQSGSAMTYGKRYAFVNAFGILTGDEDTDAGTPPQTPVKSNPVTYQVQQNPILSYAQQKKIFALLHEKNIEKNELDGKIEKVYHKDSITKLSVAEAAKIIDNLEKAEVRVTGETLEDKESEKLADEIESGLQAQQA